jgi:uncharacterized protein (UPF0548 family)
MFMGVLQGWVDSARQPSAYQGPQLTIVHTRRGRATIVGTSSWDGAHVSELTYPEVGATAGTLPDGYHHVRASRQLGRGPDVFDAASTALLSWQMHERAGVTRLAGPDVAAPGHDVAFRWLALRFECRVVSVLDGQHLRGFTYGTLVRHPERGEERFVVELDPRTQVVTATITAFSKPSGTRRYLASLAALADPRDGQAR